MAHSTESRAPGFWPLAIVFALFVLTVAIPLRHYLFVLRAPTPPQESNT